MLIVGNSFIGSSQVGNILQQMCGSAITVDAISRGYAEVSTYTQNSHIPGRIRSGDYSAVFVCGFYSYGNVSAVPYDQLICQGDYICTGVIPNRTEEAFYAF